MNHMIELRPGFSLVENLLAVSLFLLIVTASIGALIYGDESAALAGNRARALALAEEGLEAVRNIRDAGYANLTDGSYGLTTSTNQWNLFGSSDFTGIFTRQVDIGANGANRKFVTSTVTWQQNAQRTGSVSLVAWITNWIAAGGGGGPNRAGWATPAQASSLGFSGVEDGVKVWWQGDYAYVVRDGGTPDFLVVDVVGAPFVAASLSLTGTPTNIYVSGNYAYVSNQDDAEELQVVDITTPTLPFQAGSFNALGSANANGVYASGTMAYIVRDSSSSDELVVINVTTPSLPSLAGSLNLAATGFEVWVSSTFAYIASGSNTQELQVANVGNPSFMTIVGTYNLTGNTDAITIIGFVTTTLIGQGAQFALINITSPAAPSLTTSFNTAQTVRDIAVFADNTLAFLAGDSGSSEFSVIDILTQSTPAQWGSFNLTDSLNGVAYDATRDRAYAVGVDDTEFYVFAPQ
jgi:Tfp pilus assembly protein PilV